MALKDTKLEEKEQLVIKGTIFADEFRNRQTGERIEESTEPVDYSKFIKVHEFAEGTVLTDEILSQVKSGDIVKVANMEFVVNNKVNQSPRSITGKMIGAVSDDSITFIELDWIKGEELEPVMKTVETGEELDSDTSVSISTDDGTTWGEPISLKQFISNCEAGNVYTTAGTQAKIHSLFEDGKDFRIILIGLNADVLASDDTTTVNTTWNFLDMPEHQVRLGLPFNVIDWGSNMGRAFANAYLDGTNESALTWYPSNRGGYTTAVGLSNVLHVIYEGLPLQLKRAIKTVRKAFNIPRQYRSIAANGGTETDSSTTGYIAQKLFHLSATESGSGSYGSEGTAYPYLNSNERRIRYYNGVAAAYWLRTPHPSGSSLWMGVFGDGGIGNYGTSSDYGVAPAFCI